MKAKQLREKAIFSGKEKIIGEQQPEVYSLYKTMVEFMADNPMAYGISSIQLGSYLPMFVLRDSGMFLDCYIYPTILTESKKMKLHDETCVSFPGVICSVPRPQNLKMNWLSINQKTVKINEKQGSLSGKKARTVLHMIDHLNGIIMLDKAMKIPENSSDLDNYHRIYRVKSEIYKYDYFTDESPNMIFSELEIDPLAIEKELVGIKIKNIKNKTND